MDWVAFGAIATGATGLIILISLVVLARQIRELRRATHAQVYNTVLATVQNEDVRKARRILFGLAEKELSKWTEQEILEAEKVCHTYDSIGIIVHNHLLPLNIIVSWRYSVVQSWNIALPLVKKYRVDRSAPDFWDDFEWLAKEFEKKKPSYIP